MIVVIVVFLAGGLLTRYGCQAFLPDDGNITGLAYLQNQINTEFTFNDELIDIDLNAAIM